MEEYHRVDEECEEEVDQHAANHDKQPLPSGLGAKLPRFGGLLHLLGIKTLVYHSRYLAVSSQGQPAHAILGIALARLETEQFSGPFADVHIENDKEFLHPYTEEFGEKHVASLVKEY